MVLVGAVGASWRVNTAKELAKALAWRDARGGALFYITPDGDKYPSLTIRVTEDYADVHYWPYDGHAGFRALGGKGLPAGGWTTFLYEGCDPGTGEETPNEFILPFTTARSLAKAFLHAREKSDEVEWLEL